MSQFNPNQKFKNDSNQPNSSLDCKKEAAEFIFFKKAMPSLIQDVDKSIILICLSNDWNRFYNLHLYSSI